MSTDQKEKKTFAPARAISGFPEFLPEVRAIELQWLDIIRDVFESYGYASVETRSVEEIETIASKGADVDKEIYTLGRLAAVEGEGGGPRLALHFDMTVPFARYVSQNYSNLTFPLKRYQMQKAWRGERPQEGRFREFTQCDIDVIDNGKVSIRFDAEMPVVMAKALERMNVGPVELRVNNRKILQGFYEGVGIADPIAAIRIVDKLDKIGPENVRKGLVMELGIAEAAADACLRLAEIRTGDVSFPERVRALGIANPLLEEGMDELSTVLSFVLANPTANCTPYADLSIARGLDYYTGTVYEVKFADYPEYPTICGGGRYENLTGNFVRQKLPGVGLSIGLTRIFTKLLKEGKIAPARQCPTDVMLVFLPGNDHAALSAVATQLRNRGVNVETFHEQTALDKQLRYASRKGIPHVWFAGTVHEVRDMNSGTQSPADPATWMP